MVDLEAQATLIGCAALGAALGYVIGFERELRGKPAGERAFGLLALGAAAVTAVGVLFFPASAEKVIAGVVTGVGFLGAGLIFRERHAEGGGQVLGLTTAASSWAAAALAIVLVILEVNRLPLNRKIDPSKARQDDRGASGDPRFGRRPIRPGTRSTGTGE